MSDYRLIHINAVRPIARVTDQTPEFQFFISKLPEIFMDGDAYKGMHWHNHGIRSTDGVFVDSLDISKIDQTNGPPDVITMAGWDDAKALHTWTYRGAKHPAGMKGLRDWVDRSVGATFAMWWAPRGVRVTIAEGWAKLEQLRAEGPSQDVFTIQKRFDPPAAEAAK